jgi:fido (protein-threonine AMPylation protein)
VKFLRCRSCDFLRSRLLVGGAKHDCRSTKFCAVAETRLSEIAWYERGQSPLELEEHAWLAHAMNFGHKLARRRIDNIHLPSTAPEFLMLIKAIHGWIFGPTKLVFAGRFRQPGEPGVEYGGRGIDGQPRQGYEPQQIESELIHLFSRDLNDQHAFPTLTREAVARRCARFLERFFRIHPFHDGNGRVARLVIRLIARRTSNFEFTLVPDHDQGHHDYAKALERAHRIIDDREGGLPNTTDPYGPLTSWLLDYLVMRPREVDCDEPEVPPTWLAH